MIVTLGLRVLQIIFGAIVLALSVTLVLGQVQGKAPSQTEFAAFCGGCGILFALIGVVVCFVEKFQGILMIALDGLATLFTVAGGIALSVALKIHSCSTTWYIESNDMIRAVTEYSKVDGIKVPLHSDISNLGGRCHEAQATTAFLFFMFAAFAGTLILGLVGKGGRNGSIV